MNDIKLLISQALEAIANIQENDACRDLAVKLCPLLTKVLH